MKKLLILTLLVLVGVFGAYAGPITFTTNTAVLGQATGFGNDGSGGLVLNSTLGAAAAITFAPRGTSTVNAPTGIDFGTFTVTCATCSTAAIGAGALFPAFTFDLVITETSPFTAGGAFVGTASAGTVFSDQNPITINWSTSPTNNLQLGQGTSNALSGNFGTTYFTTSVFTQLVALNSGQVPGQTSVQGTVNDAAIPEPATMALFGSGLLALGLIRRFRRS